MIDERTSTSRTEAARIDIRSSRPLTPSGILPVAAVPVVVQDDRILVELDL